MAADILQQITNLDYAHIADAIASSMQKWVKDSGADGLIFGLSGGIDSAVAAYLCSRAAGRKATAMILPDTEVSPESESGDALRVAEILDMPYKLLDIRPIVKANAMYLEPDQRALGNMRARIRASLLYYYANAKNLLVAGTSDKSELQLGYFTKYGDGAADILPLSRLYKTQVRRLAEHLGVPDDIISKKSSPHLWPGQQAEFELGAKYEEIDAVLHLCLDKGLEEGEAAELLQIPPASASHIMSMRARNLHKLFPPKECRIENT